MTAPVLEDRRPRPGRLAGFALLLGAVSWSLGAFAAYPWPASDPGAAMIRVAFKHVAAFEHAGAARSAAELEKLPRHMRPTSPERVQTGRRVATVLRVELDGRVLLERRYSPGGLRGDGPTFAYEELAVRPGRYRLGVTLADETAAGGAAPRRWQLDEEVVIARGQALLVEFSEDTGLLRRASRGAGAPASPGPRGALRGAVHAQYTAAARYSPNTSRSVPHTSPIVA
jgi:hypothetical protein